jgi:hypothetical protein
MNKCKQTTLLVYTLYTTYFFNRLNKIVENKWVGKISEANLAVWGGLYLDGTDQNTSRGFQRKSQKLIQICHAVSTVRLESHYALRLRYVDFIVSVEVAVEVCCYLTVFS